MGDWPEFPLESFVDESRSICYGIVQPGKLQEGGVPVVRVNNFKDGRIEVHDALTIDPEIERKYQRSRLEGGELLVTLVGTMGLSAIVPKELRGWNVARAVGVIPLKEDVDKRWINFVLRSQPSQDFIRTHANTTVQATFNLRDLARLPVPMPPDDVRLPVSELLSALDDKIEVNRRTNETLEEMARAIFKDWFVDFGPTRAKAEGREPYLAPELWSLFPDALDDEDKPVGWEARPLDEIADRHTENLTPARFEAEEFDHYSIPAFDSSGMPAVDRGAEIKSAKTIVQQGSVLLSKLNPEIERVWLPRVSGEKRRIASTEFLVLSPRKPFGKSFLFGLFTDSTFRLRLAGMVTGTSKSHQRVPPKSLLAMEIIDPGEKAVAALEQTVWPLLEKVLLNREENFSLASLRDLLLPKLLSGEIRLKDAERAVEAVA